MELKHKPKDEPKNMEAFPLEELNTFLEEIKNSNEFNNLLFMEENESNIDCDCIYFLNHFN
jgi:hypothetical protein